MAVHPVNVAEEAERVPNSTDALNVDEEVIHVVDDDAEFLEAIWLQLSTLGFTVEAYYSASQFLSTYRLRPAECLLLDLRMPDVNGLGLQEILRRSRLDLPTVFISAYTDVPDIVRAVRGGALNYLVKPIEEKVLLANIRKALDVDRRNKAGCRARKQMLCKLTDREREVMELLLEARTTNSVANQLGISPKTVEKHRINIFHKLQVGSVPELMRLVVLGR